MSIKSWLAGLGIFLGTQGAVAQSSEPKTEDKSTNTIEATVMGGGTIDVTPVQSSPEADVEVTVKDSVPTAGMKVKLAKVKKTKVGEKISDLHNKTIVNKHKCVVSDITCSNTLPIQFNLEKDGNGNIAIKTKVHLTKRKTNPALKNLKDAGIEDY